MRVIENGSVRNVAARLRVRVTREGGVNLSLEGGLRGDLVCVALEALGRAVAPRCTEPPPGEAPATACL